MSSCRHIVLFMIILLGGLSAFTVQAADIITVKAALATPRAVLGSTVIPYKEVTLSALTSGNIKYVGGEVGSTFNQGVSIAQIDEAQLMARRNVILAQIQTAQSGLQTSQAQYTRELISPRSKDIGLIPGMGFPAMMDMFMTRPIAEAFSNDYDSDVARYSDLVTSASGVAQAQGGLRQAYSQLQEIDAALRNTQSVTPFDGMIMAKMVEEGDTVQAGQTLLRYGYIKRKRLLAEVPSGMIALLSQGDVLPVKIDGSSTLTEAKVSQIYPIADPKRHTVTVKLDLPADIDPILGLYAEIHLPNKRTSVDNTRVVIPESALLKGRSLPSVLVMKDKESQLRLVRLGAKLDNGNVEVLSGLVANDHIINNPLPTAASGWMPTTPAVANP